jgi:hypothetical protein
MCKITITGIKDSPEQENEKDLDQEYAKRCRWNTTKS